MLIYSVGDVKEICDLIIEHKLYVSKSWGIYNMIQNNSVTHAVVYIDKNPVGCCIRAIGWPVGTYVKTSHRRMGIGTQMFQKLKEIYDGHMYFDDRKISQRFYRKANVANNI